MLMYPHIRGPYSTQDQLLKKSMLTTVNCKHLQWKRSIHINEVLAAKNVYKATWKVLNLILIEFFLIRCNVSNVSLWTDSISELRFGKVSERSLDHCKYISIWRKKIRSQTKRNLKNWVDVSTITTSDPLISHSQSSGPKNFSTILSRKWA